MNGKKKKSCIGVYILSHPVQFQKARERLRRTRWSTMSAVNCAKQNLFLSKDKKVQYIWKLYHPFASLSGCCQTTANQRSDRVALYISAIQYELSNERVCVYIWQINRLDSEAEEVHELETMKEREEAHYFPRSLGSIRAKCFHMTQKPPFSLTVTCPPSQAPSNPWSQGHFHMNRKGTGVFIWDLGLPNIFK